MNSTIDKSQIIKQFRRNGFNLDSNCLKHITDFVLSSTNKPKMLKTLITKINQISINSNQPFGQNMVKTAVQILSLGQDSKFGTYEQIVQSIRKLTITYISPYEVNTSRFFIENPESHLFKFDPHEIMAMDLKRFKAIEQATKETLKSNEWTIGMLYEDYSKKSHYNELTKSRLILQNQTTQIQIVFGQNFVHKYPLISGCVYAVKGKEMNKNRVLTVEQLVLPTTLSEQKQNLAKQKLHLICDAIHTSKDSVLFEAKDFQKFSTIFNEQKYKKRKQDPNVMKWILVFGGVKIDKKTVERIFKIISAYGTDPDAPVNLECIVLMLDEGEHEEIDLKVWFKKIPIFIVPHVNSEGPRLLPKIPIIKKNFNATKVITNPARFSIYGRQVQFLNIPLMKNVYQKNILSTKSGITHNQKQMAQSLSELLFSQSSTHFCSEHYPKQADYFNLREETILFVSDKACPQIECSKDGKRCKFVSVGNFSRDGEFIFYDVDPKSKYVIQCCNQKGN